MLRDEAGVNICAMCRKLHIFPTHIHASYFKHVLRPKIFNLCILNPDH